jgi:hypothetical protein
VPRPLPFSIGRDTQLFILSNDASVLGRHSEQGTSLSLEGSVNSYEFNACRIVRAFLSFHRPLPDSQLWQGGNCCCCCCGHKKRSVYSAWPPGVPRRKSSRNHGVLSCLVYVLLVLGAAAHRRGETRGIRTIHLSAWTVEERQRHRPRSRWGLYLSVLPQLYRLFCAWQVSWLITCGRASRDDGVIMKRKRNLYQRMDRVRATWSRAIVSGLVGCVCQRQAADVFPKCRVLLLVHLLGTQMSCYRATEVLRVSTPSAARHHITVCFVKHLSHRKVLCLKSVHRNKTYIWWSCAVQISLVNRLIWASWAPVTVCADLQYQM